MNKILEKNKLEKISTWYSNRHWGFYTKLVYMGYLSLKRFFKKGNLLEIGPADGEMTRFLVNDFEDITIVDASQKYVEEIQNKFPNIIGFVSLIEEFKPPRKYDNILFTHILEHVEKPIMVLN